MQLLGDVGHVGSHFFLFGDSFSVSARKVHSLHQTYHRLRNRLVAPDVLLGDEAQVKARFSSFGDSANLDAK